MVDLDAINLNIFKSIDRALNKILGAVASSWNEFCESVGYPVRFLRQINMINFAFTGDKPRMLLGARGTGKTDTVTILGVAKKIEENPNYKILIITKERERGRDIVAEIKEVLTSRGVKFQTRAKSTVRVKGCKGKEPNVACLTIRSKGIRGRHPDLVIMEDPITPDDDSATERKRVFRTYEELLKLTKNLLIIGQPVHKLDLYCKLRWQIPTMEVKWGEIPELDADLDALRAAGASEASIQASYFLVIVDDETLPLAKVKKVDYHAKKNYLFIDPSHKGGDYTAITVGGRHANNLVLAGFAFKRAWYDCLDEIKFLYHSFSCLGAGVETNGLGDLPLRELNNAGLGATGINSTEPKHERIINMATYADLLKLFVVKDERVPPYLRQANEIYNEQFLNYEYKADFDDAPDSAAGLMRILGVLEYEN